MCVQIIFCVIGNNKLDRTWDLFFAYCNTKAAINYGFDLAILLLFCFIIVNFKRNCNAIFLAAAGAVFSLLRVGGGGVV